MLAVFFVPVAPTVLGCLSGWHRDRDMLESGVALMGAQPSVL